MALFDNTARFQNPGGTQYSSMNFPLLEIKEIQTNESLFAQLRRVQDIPTEFLPKNSSDCLVLSDKPSHAGELSRSTIDNIHTFARKHINDPENPRWLLTHVRPDNSPRAQSTLVCFIQHLSPNALVDNIEGAGVANQIVVALQGLQEEGLVTTNMNYELIRRMSGKFGVFFGGSFASMADSLRVQSVHESVDKTKKVAHEKGLLSPAPAPAPSLGLGGSSSGSSRVEDN